MFAFPELYLLGFIFLQPTQASVCPLALELASQIPPKPEPDALALMETRIRAAVCSQ